LTDMDGDELSGTFDAVAVLQYSPSATFSSGDILSQTLTVQVPKTVGAKNMWYYDAQGRYIMFDDAPSDDDTDATVDVFTYTFDPTQGILPSGQLVFFGNEAVKLEPPASTLTGFNATAAQGGQIRIIWDVDVPPNEGELFVLEICEVVGTECNEMIVSQPVQSVLQPLEQTVKQHTEQHTQFLSQCVSNLTRRYVHQVRPQMSSQTAKLAVTQAFLVFKSSKSVNSGKSLGHQPETPQM